MKDWKALEARYLGDRYPTRMGNLASNLARIKTQIRKKFSPNTIEYLLQESKLFVEWAGKDQDMDIEVAAELLELQRQLVQWQMHWSDISQNLEERAKVADRSQFWSDRLLKLSGLL